MPDRIRLTALFANLFLILTFGFVGLVGLTKGPPVLWLFSAVVIAIAAFNLHAIRKAALLLAEEEWLKAEIRKEHLRRELADLRAAEQPRDAPRLIEGPPP
jgi:hypothetical protein